MEFLGKIDGHENIGFAWFETLDAQLEELS